MQLTEYQIGLYAFSESQVEFINATIKLAHSQGISEGIEALVELKSK